MSRIRCIKPEFTQSESMGKVSRDARLCFVEMWTIADDEGRLRGSSRMLASLLFPYDDDAPGLIDKWLSELEEEGCIIRYEVSGSHYIQIANWLNHQKIDRPSKSKIPPVPDDYRIIASPRESSCEDLRIKDQGSKDSEPKGSSAETAPDQKPAVDLKAVVFGQGLDWIAGQYDKPRDKYRSILGKMCSENGDAAVIDALGRAQREGVLDPIPWMRMTLKARSRASPRQTSISAALDNLRERLDESAT